MVAGSKKAVYAALFGNLGIAIAKMIAAIMTGSSAMWSETYHSFSDTFNQVLLLIGIRTSTKLPSERHPFGFGKEQFFWSFVVATMLFGISGILSLEKGFGSLYNPIAHIENVEVSYVILLISAVFEGNALRIAFKLFRQTIELRGEKFSLGMLLTEFQESKDPTLLTVMVEDSAALLGLGIAAVGVYLSDLTGNTIYDALSSVAIGIVPDAICFLPSKENRALLIGEAISKRDYNRIIESVLSIQEVNRVISLRTMHFGPKDVLVAMDVSLADNMNTDSIELVIDSIERVRQVLNLATPSKIYVEVERGRLSCPL